MLSCKGKGVFVDRVCIIKGALRCMGSSPLPLPLTSSRGRDPSPPRGVLTGEGKTKTITSVSYLG